MEIKQQIFKIIPTPIYNNDHRIQKMLLSPVTQLILNTSHNNMKKILISNKYIYCIINY